MTALEALTDVHRVTLFTRVDPDLPALDRYFDTSVGDVEVVTLSDVSRLLRVLPAVGSALDRVADRSLARLRRVAFMRYAARRARGFDAVLDTSGEGIPGAVVYKHKPESDAGRRGLLFHPRLVEAVAGFDPRDLRDATVLANSEWTAAAVADRHGVAPTVVYPPVDAAAFGGGLPWEVRERGFVSVGRLSPEKNVLELVDVVRRLRERGHDVHYHVVGPPHDAAYAARVREAAARTDGVDYEGELPRERLVDLLSRHRYGLHGRENEHFGIGVAEMVAAGALPFVPDSGGQREVVGADERLTFSSPAEAVERIESVVADPDRERAVRDALPDVEERFGRERFERRIREVVAAAVAADGDHPVAVPSSVTR